MRLIDADALGEKLETLMKKYAASGNKNVADDYNFVLTVLACAPTVDAVEVVRCVDCKHFDPDDQAAEDADWCGWCRYNGCLTDDFDFCSRGKRKTDDRR